MEGGGGMWGGGGAVPVSVALKVDVLLPETEEAATTISSSVSRCSFH